MSVNHPQLNKRPSEKYSPESITKNLKQASPHGVESSAALLNDDPSLSFSLHRPHGGGDNQGAFNNARNFVMNHPVFVEKIHIHGARDNQLSTVLHRPPRLSTSGTEMDLSSWYPPSLCNPGNRQALVAKLNAWNLCSCQCPNIFWHYEPAGLNKPTMARTFAYSSHIHPHSNATVFAPSSRIGGHCDIYKIFPILLYFAVHSPGYHKGSFPQILANSPRILGNLAVLIQFQKFVVEPFRILVSRLVTLFLFMCLAIIFGTGKSITK